MNKSLERLWVSWLNSDRWRQFAKWGPGAHLFRSQAYRKFNTTRRFVTTAYKSYRKPALFHDVETFCTFIGHVKSGGTLLGSLLDAHPDAVLADEADVLRYVAAGFSRDQIYHILLKGSRRAAMKGRVTARRLTPYSFAVPGQWQGRYRTIQVIGDSRAGPTTRKLGREPERLQHLFQTMTGVDVKFVQVIRNPYDPISAMIVRGKRSFDNAIEHYFAYCETLTALRNQLDNANLMAVKYEEVIYQPKAHLDALCRFLGLTADDEYLSACVSILDASPQQHRHLVAWDPHWIEVVQTKIDQFDFLAGYTYAS